MIFQPVIPNHIQRLLPVNGYKAPSKVLPFTFVNIEYFIPDFAKSFFFES